MEKKFNGEEQIGEIVSDFPGASNLFKKYNIDFCCGGKRTLTKALRQRKLDEEAFLQQLNEAYRKRQSNQHTVDWRKARYLELVDHIMETHHDYLREELPVLSAFVTKVAYRHGAAHPELTELHPLFHRLKEELEEHLDKEEEEIFPLVKEYEETVSRDVLDQAVQVIDRLEAEHDQTGELLKEMRRVSKDYALPEDACRTYTLSFSKLEELEADMFQHIHLENNVLFERLRQSVR